MKNVLVVVGAKKRGKTSKIVERFVEGALAAGHSVECEYLFNKRDMHGCIDCQACKGNGGTCILEDDMPEMLDKLIACDVLVFASPVYFFSISAQLKMFMDRTYAKMESIKNKEFYFITTGEGPSASYPEDFRRVVEPIQGWLDCFEGMTFKKTLACFDTGTMDVMESEAYKEAKAVGAAL